MPRAIWKGAITFGLVNVPVNLYSAEKTGGEISFHLLDSRNQARVRYQRVNEVNGEEVPWARIVKAYELSDDNFVVITEEEFDKVAPEYTRTVDVSDFVDLADIEPVYFGKPYYLVPQKGGEKGYVLLREAMKKAGKCGIARVVIRTREHLAAVVPREKALLLVLLRFKNEVREADEFDLPTRVRAGPKELEMAETLIEAMSSKWKPGQYKDEYREELLKYIKQKAKEGEDFEPPEPDEEEKPSRAEDLMDLLQKSLKAAKR